MTEIGVCPEISVLSSFLDGELIEEENARVEFHIQNCAVCAGRSKRLEAGDRLLVRNLGKSMSLSEYSKKKDCLSPDTVASYLHDLLSAEEKTKVEGHLDLCDVCLSEITFLAKAEMKLSQSRVEPLPDFLRERVEALWEKGDRPKERILRVALRLAKEGIEILRDSLFPQTASFQEVFATAGAYRATTKGSLPSGVLVKRTVRSIQLSLLVEW